MMAPQNSARGDVAILGMGGGGVGGWVNNLNDHFLPRYLLCALL